MSLLVVGSGGIGCEVLKSLVLHGQEFGIEKIVTIDLDAIDLSNLNRQFLFRRAHIGQSKAIIAASVVSAFNPSVVVQGISGNIKEDRFNVDFFSSFRLVCNALDNVSARRHVNRMCLAANVPLVESGSAGFLGQVSVIKGGLFECYECTPKPTPKTFAVCTINSTPSKTVHTVVWAKKLYADLFGPQEDSPVVNAEEDEFAAKDAHDYQDEPIRLALAEMKALDDGGARAQALFHRHFYHDIWMRMRVAELAGKNPWHMRAPPAPLTAAAAKKLPGQEWSDTAVPSVAACAQAFVAAVDALLARDAPAAFDKDDAMALQFVAASSNLRSHVFGIPLETPFEIKSIAGSIVPAIATTNAVVAGLLVLEALKVLSGRDHQHRSTYLVRKPTIGRKLLSSAPSAPNPACYVCQKATQTLTINTATTTLQTLLDLLKGDMGFVGPEVFCGDNVIFESGDGLDSEEKADYAAALTKTMAELGLGHNAVFNVNDFQQSLECQVIVLHKDNWEEDDTQDSKRITHTLTGEAPKKRAREDASGDDDEHSRKTKPKDANDVSKRVSIVD